MSGWPRVPLGEVLTPANNRITLDPDETYAQVTARLWGKGLTLRGKVKGVEIAAAQQNRVQAGQFVISKIDARHGAFGIVPAELDGAVVSSDFPVFDVNIQQVLPSYIAWVSKTEWFVRLCKQASEGSTNRVRLKQARFLAQQIPVPPLLEQRNLVDRLDTTADAIAKRSTASDAVGAQIQAMLRSAFVRIAAGTRRVPMGEIAPLVRRSIAVEPDDSYQELGVRSFGKGTFHKPTLEGAEVGTKKLFRIEAGDLLFNIVFAWEGAVAVAQPADTGRVGSHRFLTCVPDPNEATSEFLCFWFLTDDGLQSLGRASPGGAGRNRTLGIKALERIDVPVPSLDAQVWFNDLQARARAARRAQAEVQQELEKLLPAMLHSAFAELSGPTLPQICTERETAWIRSTEDLLS